MKMQKAAFIASHSPILGKESTATSYKTVIAAGHSSLAQNFSESTMSTKLSNPRNTIDLERFIQSRINPKLYNCEYCDQTFFQLCNLKRHEKVHTGERPYYCDICKRGFTTFSNLKQHQQTHENSDERRRFSCQYCSRAYYYQNSLKKHLKIHKNQNNGIIATTSTEEEDTTHEFEPAVRKHVHLDMEEQQSELTKSSEINISYRQNDPVSQDSQTFDLTKNLISDQNHIKTNRDLESVSLTLSLLFDKLKILKQLHQIKISEYQGLKKCQEASPVEDNEEGLMNELLQIASRITAIKEDVKERKMNQKAIDTLSSIANIDLPYQPALDQFHLSPSPLQTSCSQENSSMSEEVLAKINLLTRDSTEEAHDLECQDFTGGSGEALNIVKGRSNRSHLSNQTKPEEMQVEPLLVSQENVDLYGDLFPDQPLPLERDQDFLSDYFEF